MRRAFTIIETLVVVAIIGVLMAVMLAAIHAVRAAADRIGCASNMRQIGIALHSYHDAEGHFPVGSYCPLAVSSPAQASGMPAPWGIYNDMTRRYPWYGWATWVLPYLDESATYAAFNVRLAPWNNEPFFTRHPRVFQCPADPCVGLGGDGWGGKRIALSSYLGCLGTDQFRNDGILTVQRWTTIGDVSDGLANTVLAGERVPGRLLGRNGWYGWLYGGQGAAVYVGACDTVLGVCERLGQSAEADRFRPGNPTEETHHTHYWSCHVGGCNFLMGDGSVRFITYDTKTLDRLATRAGSEE